MIKAKISDLTAAALKKLFNCEEGFDIFTPENENFGHYSTNAALKIAKTLKQNPMEVAESIVAEMLVGKNKFFEKVEVASPGFINFRVSQKILQKEFDGIYKAGGNWGKAKKKGKKTIVIDYCGVNIAKPMGVGHLRSTIIGQALYNILKFNGLKVIGDNHLGDWGKQFGVLIAAYKEYKAKRGSAGKNGQLSIGGLMELYVNYTARMKTDVKLEDIAREETKKLQSGEKENIKIWKEFHKITFGELRKIFKILGIKFDHQLGESFYNPMLKGIVENALQKKVAVKSEGAIVIFTDNDKAPFIIQKSDGAYLYGTTDIATVKYRVEKFKADEILYVVGNEQSFHLDQLFKAAKMLGIIKNQKLVHVKFGLVLGEDMKKLSTRAGKHVSLADLLDEAVRKSAEIVNKKNPKLSAAEKKKVAEAVGIGAVKYNDLSQNRQSGILFEWDKMLNFEGNSAPYIQYTYARLKSILRKGRAPKYDSKYLAEKLEIDLILKLEKFPEVIESVADTYFTHQLPDYLFELAKTTNVFYQTLPVLKADKEKKEARLALIKSVTEVLKTGLNLLGIEVLEKM